MEDRPCAMPAGTEASAYLSKGATLRGTWKGPPVPQCFPVTVPLPFFKDSTCLIWRWRITHDYKLRISRVFLSLVTIGGFTACFLSVPNVFRTCSGSLGVIFISDANVHEMTMDPFFLCEGKILWLSLWRGCSASGKSEVGAAWDSFHSIKTCAFLVTGAGGAGRKVWPPWQTGTVSLALIFSSVYSPFSTSLRRHVVLFYQVTVSSP